MNSDLFHELLKDFDMDKWLKEQEKNISPEGLELAKELGLLDDESAGSTKDAQTDRPMAE